MLSLILFSKSKNSFFQETPLSPCFCVYVVTLSSKIEPVSERWCFLDLYIKAKTFFLRSMKTRHQMKAEKK